MVPIRPKIASRPSKARWPRCGMRSFAVNGRSRRGHGEERVRGVISLQPWAERRRAGAAISPGCTGASGAGPFGGVRRECFRAREGSIEAASAGSTAGASSGAWGSGSGNVLIHAPVSLLWIFLPAAPLSVPTLVLFGEMRSQQQPQILQLPLVAQDDEHC